METNLSGLLLIPVIREADWFNEEEEEEEEMMMMAQLVRTMHLMLFVL